MRPLLLLLLLAPACGSSTAADAAELTGVDAGGAATSVDAAADASNACLGANGDLASTVTACATTADCTTITIRTCCGSDSITGMAKTARCAFPVPTCGALGCAKFVNPRADDGQTAQGGATIEVMCQAGRCTTFVALDAGPSDH
jgi:hypothetical protein